MKVDLNPREMLALRRALIIALEHCDEWDAMEFEDLVLILRNYMGHPAGASITDIKKGKK